VVVGGLGIIAFAAQVINTGVEYYKALAANQEWYAALAAQRKNHTDDQEDINEKRRSGDYVGALEIGMARLADLPEDDRPNWIDNSLIALHRQAAEQIAVEGLINEASKQASGSPQERRILQAALGAAGDEPCLVDKVGEAMNFNAVVAVDGQPVDGGQAPPQAALGIAHADDDPPQTVDDICARLWKFGLPLAPQCFAQGPSDQAPGSRQAVASQNTGQTGASTPQTPPGGGAPDQGGGAPGGSPTTPTGAKAPHQASDDPFFDPAEGVYDPRTGKMLSSGYDCTVKSGQTECRPSGIKKPAPSVSEEKEKPPEPKKEEPPGPQEAGATRGTGNRSGQSGGRGRGR
jgi:hypothetical protein